MIQGKMVNDNSKINGQPELAGDLINSRGKEDKIYKINDADVC